MGLTTDRFFNPGNISNLVLQVSIVSIVAVGSTIVIFSGGIDLSPGSAIALMTMVFAVSHRDLALPLALVIPLILVFGAGFGLINGVLTAYLRIPSFITTLAALSAFRGAAFMFNNGSPISSLSPLLEPLFYGSLVGIPAAAVLRGRDLRAGLLVSALHGVGTVHLCRRRQCQRRPAVRHRCPPDAADRLHHRRGDGGVAAMLMVARLNSGSPNYGVGTGAFRHRRGRGRRREPRRRARQHHQHHHRRADDRDRAKCAQPQRRPDIGPEIVIGAIIVLAVGIDMWRGELMHFVRQFVSANKST